MVSQSDELVTKMNSDANEILKLIQETKTETLLWSSSSLKSRIANKRANFLLNTQHDQQPKQQQQLQHQQQLEQQQQQQQQQQQDKKVELVVYWKGEIDENFNENQISPDQENKLHDSNNNDKNDSESDVACDDVTKTLTTSCPPSLYLEQTQSYSLKQNQQEEGDEEEFEETLSLQEEDQLGNTSSCDEDEDFTSNYLQPVATSRPGKSTNIVRRNSSTDSGIVVRTPSQSKNEHFKIYQKLPLCRSKTVGVTSSNENPQEKKSVGDSQPKQLNCRRSNSLPTSDEIEKLKSAFSVQTIKNDFLTELQQQRDTRNCPSSLPNKPKITKSNNNIFDITNFLKRNKNQERRRIRRRGRSMCEQSRDKNEVIAMSFDINFTDHHGDTCLHHASSMGDTETIKYLLKHGGNVWLKNNKDCLPLDVCNDFNSAKLLSQATIFYTDNERHTKDNNIASTVKLAFSL